MMPSRQMAFQISESEFQEILIRLAKAYDEKGGGTLGEWIDSIDPDPKVRQKLQAVLTISVQCQEKKLDPWNIRKLICWRDEKGEPGPIEAQWKNYS